MSRFFSSRFAELKPYVPGEQPQDKKYIKLNTNESPFTLPMKTRRQMAHDAKNFHLYPDPECTKVRRVISSLYGIEMENIMLTNGSDEALNFIFSGFCDKGAVSCDITYGFYPVFAKLNNVEYSTIPLNEDFSIPVEKFYNSRSTIFIANPNAPTGLYLPPSQIEEIVLNNRDNLVVVDEAYVDFGSQSSVPLVKKYDNLIVVQTFSKSRFAAGLRLGMVFASKFVINDLNTLRYSVNPYNVNYAALSAAYAIIRDEKYRKECSRKIIENRKYVKLALQDLGFEVTDSRANFVFIRHKDIAGEELYLRLKEKGILIRHFNQERIKDYNRVSIGDFHDMKKFVKETASIIKEIKKV